MDDQTIINSRETSGRFLSNRTHLTPRTATFDPWAAEMSPGDSAGPGCWRYRGLPLLGGQRVVGPPAVVPRAAEEEGRGQQQEGGGGQQDEPEASKRTDYLHTGHRSHVTHINKVHVYLSESWGIAPSTFGLGGYSSLFMEPEVNNCFSIYYT